MEDVWANTNRMRDLGAVLDQLEALPKLTTLYLHYNLWLQGSTSNDCDEAAAAAEVAAAAALTVASTVTGFTPGGWDLHYPAPTAPRMKADEYKAAVTARLPKLEQLDDTFR